MVSVVSPAWFSADEMVSCGLVDPRVLAVAKEHVIAVMPLIVNPGFNQEALSRLLHNADARQRAIVQWSISAFSIAWRDTVRLREPPHERPRCVHAVLPRDGASAPCKGFKLSVAVVHRPDEQAGPTGYHKWLFKNCGRVRPCCIGKRWGFVSVMTYSQHTRRTTPGQTQGSVDERRCAILSQVHAAEKLSLVYLWSRSIGIPPSTRRASRSTPTHGSVVGLCRCRRAAGSFQRQGAVER